MKTWSTKSNYKIVQVLSGRSNVFLLTNSFSHILVDTGPGFMWNTLLTRLNRLRVEKIDLLFLTHSHFDHSANAHKIREQYNARVIIHKSEAGYLATGDNVLPVGTNPVTRSLVRVLAKQFIHVARYQPCQPDYVFETVYDLSEYGYNAFLVHTPGHTIGSSSLVIDKEVAAVGDTMFGVFPRTIFPPFASDTAQMLNSWKILLDTGCRIFIPSHGTANERSLVEKELGKKSSGNSGSL